MTILGKKQMSEEDIKLNFITPAIQRGWKGHITMETRITDGRINIRGNIVVRSKPKFADYLLYLNDGKPIAVVEAKDNNHSVSHGLQQAMTYAQMMDLPFAYSSNGDAFYEHDFLTGQELVEISEDEIPFDIPESWKWVRWGNLSFSIQYGYNAPAKKSGRIRMVRISDIQGGKVIWDSIPFCDIKEEEIPTYLLSSNDILFARTGGTVGKSYIVKEIPEEAIYAGYLIRTRYSDMLCPEYLYYFMQTHLYWTQLRNGTIATAQPNCNGQTLSKMILPLPPLAEQKRIVAKIEELLPLCDRLRK